MSLFSDVVTTKTKAGIVKKLFVEQNEGTIKRNVKSKLVDSNKILDLKLEDFVNEKSIDTIHKKFWLFRCYRLCWEIIKLTEDKIFIKIQM